MRSWIPSIQNLHTARCSSHRFLLSRVGCPEWIDSHVTVPFGRFAARLTEMEQSFSARMCKIKTGAVSTASVSGSPSGSWPLPGQVDGSTAAGSHDQGHPKKARIQDADSINSQDRNHICSTRQEFVARFRDHGLPCSVDSPFCNTSAAILVRQSTSPEDREIGRRFAPLLEVVAPKLQEIFPEHDTEGKFVVPAPDFRHKSSAFSTAETELENQFSGLRQLDTNRSSMSLHLV